MEGGDLSMSNIDQRVVQMLFDNKVFEQGIATTLSSLDRLNEKLKLQGATKGLSDVDDASKKVSFGALASGVDALANKFSSMSVIGIAALTNITNKVINAGIEVAKAFTIDPVRDGFQNYETQINAVQTILANTGLKGAAGLSQVNKVLADLNTYANQTVYNFSDMTKNIGTFTAAGVGLQASEQSIKGIANLAALSGSTSDQASTAMYQLSQAIAAGRVQLQDWNSVVNAGLGGKVFQTALENTARASGVAIDSIIKKAGGFRNSLQKDWLTSDILTKTLSQFTGDLSTAQLKAQGFTQQQIVQIQALGQTAVGAATKIKTMSQLTQALKEEVATAYGAIFKTIFGDINQATDLFSSIHTVAENALTGPIYALNNLLQAWDKLGGRTELIKTLSDAFHNLERVLGPIRQAFDAIFPTATAQELYNLTKGLDDFVNIFKISQKTADEVKRTFAGVFAIFSVAIFIVKQLVMTIVDLLGYLGDGSGGFLNLTAKMGDALVKFKEFVEQGNAVNKFFGVLGKILAVPILLVQALAGYVQKLFDKFDGAKASKAIGAVTDKLGPLGQLAKLASDAWGALVRHFGDIVAFFEPLAQKADAFVHSLIHSITSGLGSLNVQDVLNVVNTALFGGLILLVKKFVDKFRGGGGALGDFVDTIKETFEGLTKTLETMQGTLKAATLLEIATAVGILTIAVIALSKIDQAGLIRSSLAITVMFTQLMGSLTIFSKFIETEGFAKMPFMMGSLILLAIAIDTLTIAVKMLASLDWGNLSKGLLGLGVLMGELVATLKLMGNPEGLIATSLGLNAFAKAVNVLAQAVVTLSGLSLEQLGKGLTGIAGLLTSLALFTKFAEADKTGISAGLGIILLATGIKILATSFGTFANFSWSQIAKGLASMGGALALMAGALKLIPPESVLSAAGVLIVASSLGLIGNALAKMGQQSWGEIAKGVATLGGALLLIATALTLMPPSSILSAAAVLIVAASLGMLSDALGKMGGMSWGEIAKGLVTLAASLAIIAAALIFMEGTLPGSAALLVAAVALEVLLPVIKALGTMGWATLAEGLAGLAGVFVVLGAAGLLLAPLTPILLALGAAIALIGVGMALTGAGVFLFAAGLTALSVAGTAGAAALVGIVTTMLGLLPEVAKAIGLAVIAFAETIQKAGPAILGAMVTVILAMASAIDKTAPKVVTTLLSLLLMLLQKLVDYVPKLIDAGGNLIIAVLNGIARKIPGIVDAAVRVVTAFINAVGAQGKPLADAGFNALINFINGVADSIRQHTAQLVQAGKNLAGAILSGLTGGLLGGSSAVGDAARAVAESALTEAQKALDSHSPSRKFYEIGTFATQGFANGLTGTADVVAKSSENLGKTALLSMSKTIAGMSDLIQGSIDLTPTITPVLDLTNIKKNAGQIGSVLGSAPISIDTTYSSAKIASAGYTQNQSATTQAPTTPQKPAGFSFTQNNYSPKALSSAEIYRQTKNQLSQVRGVLVYQGVGDQQPG
jgi:tape measure domain-containing protein